ncbi:MULTISPECIES: MbtH family protein [unclassified Rhizobium]|uniref:MbtH family protein n=1 Tax=unclassified Rhizobium TaxID=2613769 RepID=UPI0007EBB294|nr:MULTISPECIES: MbtH family NRPS accessory protein [unclassified Rhizobium]ANM14927.1 MbtH-like protein [Rhizobium sp. N324]ANM21315.1 MbtH-like protein [Rhizobium sp. N541]ANM27687.1 MbtH-like protein [Rhizobium sp. N941]OYD00031.1 MbtH-like protein [Rhizobium sp. N4311]
MDSFEPRDDLWIVVIDTEHHHSVWPQDKRIPTGWERTGFAGSRQECLAHIRDVWTDPRPLSLRSAMSGDARL